MIDERDVREMLLRRAHTVPATPVDAPKAVRRARRRLVLNGAVATVAAAAIAVATFAGVDAVRTAPIPADDRSEELGIFAPVAGRIVYVNEGIDRGYDPGLWAVDPSGPSDTTEGQSVADDVASTLVRLGPEEAIPLGWSSDGTELLFKRTSEDLFPQEYLYILHADGSETQLNRGPMYFGGATISPDGTRVVFAAWGDELGLYVVDAEGGRPVRLPYPSAGDIVHSPTFSPDGTQIVYLVSGDDEDHVWVADADGSDAHEILADEATVFAGVSGPEWSPAGDRLAIGLGMARGGGRLAIYTFAPDGSDFTQVITGGISPYWSPDGSQIAYTIPCDEHPDGWCPEGSVLRSEFDPQPGESPAGLAITDADGSNVRAFGFAASGPWHPVRTTEGEADRPGTYAILGGGVTFHADRPWNDHPESYIDPRLSFLVGPEDAWIEILANPLPEASCAAPPGVPASAEALVRAIRSNPDLEATVPVAERVGRIDALRLDVATVPGASTCPSGRVPVVSVSNRGAWGGIDHGDLGRLYVLDVPGGSARALVIMITAPEAAFERAVEAAAPVVDSFEFHPG